MIHKKMISLSQQNSRDIPYLKQVFDQLASDQSKQSAREQRSLIFARACLLTENLKEPQMITLLRFVQDHLNLLNLIIQKNKVHSHTEKIKWMIAFLSKNYIMKKKKLYGYRMDQFSESIKLSHHNLLFPSLTPRPMVNCLTGSALTATLMIGMGIPFQIYTRHNHIGLIYRKRTIEVSDYLFYLSKRKLKGNYKTHPFYIVAELIYSNKIYYRGKNSPSLKYYSTLLASIEKY